MKKIICLFISSILLFGLTITVKADNGSASYTYTLDSNFDIIPTQDAYIAVKQVQTFNVQNSEIQTLNKPEDIYYQENLKQFFIADTANKRILVVDDDMIHATAIGEGELNKPLGVFANANGDIYVADYGLKQVLVYTHLEEDTYEVKKVGKPDHPLYGEGTEFLPSKLVVDSVGTMYIIDAGNNNGIVTITKDLEFSGYFGANYVTPSLGYAIKFMFSTKKQKEKMYVSPIAPINLAIDDEGLINTISALEGSGLKKLNIAGNNLFGTNRFDYTNYTDLCIGPNGTIYCVNANGRIVEYDQEGNSLFLFGGKDSNGTYIGLFQNPKGIEVDSSYHLYVLDENTIQVFQSTEFAGYVHEALTLYYDGKYAESREPWEKVLQQNNMFDLAHKGLGNAYLREMKYTEAMAEFKLAKDSAAYSNAFWEVRNEWLKTYGTGIIVTIAIVIVALCILAKVHALDPIKEGHKKLWEKIYQVKLIKEVCYVKKFIKHPLDGFYEIKHENKMSIKSATFLYVIFFIWIILGNICTGFAFNTQDVETISLLKLFALSVLPMLLFVIANYLISSITEGNGKLKHVYIGTICSFTPVLIFYPFIILLSNFIVQSEAFLYTMPTMVMWGWSFALLYMMVKDIQELQFGENNKNIILTILTMILFVAFFFLVYILGKQLYDFIYDLLIEVISRG